MDIGLKGQKSDMTGGRPRYCRAALEILRRRRLRRSMLLAKSGNRWTEPCLARENLAGRSLRFNIRLNNLRVRIRGWLTRAADQLGRMRHFRSRRGSGSQATGDWRNASSSTHWVRERLRRRSRRIWKNRQRVGDRHVEPPRRETSFVPQHSTLSKQRC